MMEDEEDDIYGAPQAQNGAGPTIKSEQVEDNEEEGEEIDEDSSDSDIDIITEVKQGATSETPAQAPKTEKVKAEESVAPEKARKQISGPTKSELPSHIKQAQLESGAQFPGIHTSNIDVDAVPPYEPAGKPINELDFDVDLAEHEKPWRRPGSDQTEYFNYGFDEFTWATYCLKQKSMREAIAEQTAESQKFEMMFGGGMPGMPGMPGSGAPPTGPTQGQPQQQPQQDQQQAMGGGQMAGMGMSGMPEMSPEMMNQMMAQMMQSGVDPSQMDFGTFMQQLQQLQQGGGPPAGPGVGVGGQGQGFGGPPQGQAIGYGGGGGQQGGGNFGGGGGRQGGRKGRRW